MAKKKKKVKKNKATKKKKKVKKKVSKKSKKPAKRKSHVNVEKVQIQMQPVLVDNFVSLQRVMVNLAGKMDNLNTQLSELLNLFELSAKSLAKKGFKLEASEATAPSKEVMNKLSELSEQNKIIARGLTLMHEAPAPMPVMPPIPAPAPTPMPAPAVPKPAAPEAAYKKSAPSKPAAPKKIVKKASKK